MIFQNLQRTSFAGIEFPISELQIIGGARLEEHEYNHVPGSKIEKGGRRAYEIRMEAFFGTEAPGYADLWPDRLQDLVAKWEAEETAELVIPTLGTLRCVCKDWPRKVTFSKQQSNEDVSLTFKEDMSDDFLINALIASSSNDLGAQLEEFNASTQALVDEEPEGFTKPGASLPEKPGLFQSISDLTADIAGIKDSVEFAGNALAGKIDQLKGLVETADSTLTFLQKPRPAAQRVIDSMRELWDSVDRLKRDADAARPVLIVWKVPREMSVSTISSALYGTTENAVDIMRLNPIPDPFRVKAGTDLQVFAP